MKKISKKVTDIINGEKCPLPLEVIPNHMGINLVAVEAISWTEFEDGQIGELTIHFIPEIKDFKLSSRGNVLVDQSGKDDGETAIPLKTK